MENWETFIRKLVDLLGFKEYNLEIDEEHRHGTLFIHEDPNLVKENLPILVESLNHLIQLAARRDGRQALFLDVNNYRKEREKLILELVKASARKAIATKQEV